MKTSFLSFLLLLGGVWGWGQCPTGDIVLTTQGQVDSFAINYPGCTEVLGDLTIGHSDTVTNINSLNGLQLLTFIGGDLHILNTFSLVSLDGLNGIIVVDGDLLIYYNSGLSDLNGLSNLLSIGGNISINSNHSLTSLEGLNSIHDVAGHLTISRNMSLITLDGLNTITTIDRHLAIDDNDSLTNLDAISLLNYVGENLTLSNNAALTNLNGLESLTAIGGSLKVYENNSLTTINALTAVTSIASDIEIVNNPVLTDINGFSAITEFSGNIRISGNAALTNLDGLPISASFAGTLEIADNQSLISLSTLPQITSIGGSLAILRNDLLLNLDGLNDITTIGNGLFIEENGIITSLYGLEALSSVDGFISIFFNPNLSDINGIGNITTHNGDILISGCSQLTECSLLILCNKLANNPSTVFVTGNGSGCNSDNEVLVGCHNLNGANGIVYFDLNCNNIFDGTDQGLSHSLLFRVNDNIPISSTGSNGSYIARFLQNTTSEYTAIAPPGFTSHPTSYTITTDTTIQQFPDRDFSLCPDSLFHNLKTTLTSITVPRPGFTNQYQVCVQNLGTQPENATLTLDFSIGDDPLYITIVDAAGGSVQNNIITWNISDLQLFDSECFTVTVQIATTTPLGIYLQPKSNVSLAPLQAEIKYTDNSVELRDQVVGSYDPNDKTVNMPNISYDPTSGVTRLQYKIRFQNTGTFPATFIEVLDTLESKLDIRTIEMVAASHDYTLSFPSPNVLKWRFDNINLPDSTSNEPGSHGFIVFNISTITPINLGEMVQNRAGIYFDFNEPVITNYAVTSFTVGVHDPFGLGSLPLSIAPNPTQDNITLRYTLTESADSELIITNAQGVVVQSQRLGKQGVGDYALPVDLAGLPAGLYLVTVRAGELVGVGKVVRL